MSMHLCKKKKSNKHAGFYQSDTRGGKEYPKPRGKKRKFRKRQQLRGMIVGKRKKSDKTGQLKPVGVGS